MLTAKEVFELCMGLTRGVVTAMLGVGLVYALVTPTSPREVYMPSFLEHELCTEDMACWDCSTMGNLICGPKQGTEGRT